jgi:FkbM family methyltransferase
MTDLSDLLTAVRQQLPDNAFLRRTNRYLRSEVAKHILGGRPVRLLSGRRLVLNPRDTVGLVPYITGTYDSKELQVVSRLILPGDVVFDIGANIGYWTIALSELVGRSGKVVAFEPDPENFRILTENVRLNHATNVEAHNLALSSIDGTRLLHRSLYNSGDYSLLPVSDERDSVEVECRRLDRFCAETGLMPSFVKMDVQGHEAEVLLGARGSPLDLVARAVVLMEFAQEWLIRSDVNPLSLLLSIDQFGVEIYQFGSGRHLLRVRKDEFGDFCHRTRTLVTDLLLVPHGFGRSIE